MAGDINSAPPEDRMADTNTGHPTQFLKSLTQPLRHHTMGPRLKMVFLTPKSPTIAVTATATVIMTETVGADGHEIVIEGGGIEAGALADLHLLRGGRGFRRVQ